MEQREADCDVTAGGRRLRVRRIGSEGGPTLVFLHEGLGSITQWRDFPRALAAATGLPALVYDRLGYGASEAREGPQDPAYLEVEATRRLPQVLEACGITRPILVGHSDGATIALLFAARFPDQALAVVSEAAHVFVEDVSPEGIAKALEAFETTALRRQLEKHHGAKVDAMFHGWSDVWLAPAHRDWNMLDRLGAIKAPVLAIQGEEDAYGTPAQVEVILRGVGGPARGLLLPGCGHVPHFQARERVLAAMAAFLVEFLQFPPLMAP